MDAENIVKSENVTSEMEFELMDTNEPPSEGLAEEGEISSSGDESQAPKKRETQGSIFSNFNRNFNKNLSGGFVTGINIFDRDEAAKKIDRAKRFSIPIDSGYDPQIQIEELANLHKDLGIDKESEKQFRFNAIHMRGTDDMSTEDVFQYFEHFAPSHVQWINDKTCNVVWMDEISAARALLRLSKKIRNLDKIHLNANPFEKELNEAKELEEKMNEDEDDDDESVDARKIETAIPPGYWRLGVPAPKSSCILLRYATRSDKKQHNAEKNSEYYRKYGNPHYGNKPGIFTNSLRFKKLKRPSSRWKNRLLDQVVDKKNPWKDLAYTWGKSEREELDDEIDYKWKKSPEIINRTNVPDLRLSLEQKKVTRKRKHDEDSDSRTDETWRAKMKGPRMKMHADDEERRSSNNVVVKPVVDLRKKIASKKYIRYKFLRERELSELSPKTDSYHSESELEEDGDCDYQGKRWYSEQRGEKRKRSENEDCESVSDKEESAGSDNESDKEDHKDLNNVEDDSGKINLGHISPLRIEIDNDEYYHKK